MVRCACRRDRLSASAAVGLYRPRLIARKSAASSSSAGADTQHNSHLSRDCAHRGRVDAADDVAHLREPNGLRPVGHDLRCRAKSILRRWCKVDAQADVCPQLRGDRQHRCIGELGYRSEADPSAPQRRDAPYRVAIGPGPLPRAGSRRLLPPSLRPSGEPRKAVCQASSSGVSWEAAGIRRRGGLDTRGRSHPAATTRWAAIPACAGRHMGRADPLARGCTSSMCYT